jgi:hypothetical protein
MYFLPKLVKYIKTDLDKNQTGFVPGCGTHLNIKLLIDKIKSYKKSDKKTIIYIDLKSAYNTVNR